MGGVYTWLVPPSDTWGQDWNLRERKFPSPFCYPSSSRKKRRAHLEFPIASLAYLERNTPDSPSVVVHLGRSVHLGRYTQGDTPREETHPTHLPLFSQVPVQISLSVSPLPCISLLWLPLMPFPWSKQHSAKNNRNSLHHHVQTRAGPGLCLPLPAPTCPGANPL